MRAALLLLPLAACSAYEPAWLVAEAKAPTGAVARLWCEHRCDVPGRLLLTLSPRATPTDPAEVEGFPATGTPPAADAVRVLYAEEPHLRFTSPQALEISAPCVGSGDPEHPLATTLVGTTKIRFRQTGDCAPQTAAH